MNCEEEVMAYTTHVKILSSCWKMCTAYTIITILEKTWECLLCNFFPFFFGRPIFLFISLLVSLPRVDGILILSDRCSGLLLYYFFLFRFKRELILSFFYRKKNRKENIFIGGHSLNTTGCCTAVIFNGGRDVRSTVIISSSSFWLFTRGHPK